MPGEEEEGWRGGMGGGNRKGPGAGGGIVKGGKGEEGREGEDR